jgi:polyisoprenoid-binding protein YceI
MNKPLLSLFALPLVLAVAACDDPKSSTAPATNSASTTQAQAQVQASASASAAAPTSAAAPVVYAAPATYDFDVSHSTVGFSVKHMMVSNVKGSFGKFTGSLFLDEKDPGKSTLQVDVETATVDTKNGDRDKHLRSPDFFDSAKFPKMTFKSTKVERSGDGYSVTGDLTIKDVTKSIVLKVDSIAPEAKDPFMGALHRGAHATAKINRKDFGLTWNKAIETGGAVVGDEVTLDIDVDLVKKPGT